MRTLLQLPDIDPQTLRERLGEHACAVEEAVGLDPDAVVAPEAWQQLPRAALDRLLVVAAQESRRPVLALDARLAAGDDLARLLEQADDKLVVVCSSWPPEDLTERAARRVVVASSAGAILAVGSPAWVAARRSELGASFAAPAGAEQSADEELEDDED